MAAGLAVAEAPTDQEDFYLDLETDVGVDDFDFKLDGAYDDNAQDEPVEASAQDVGNATAEFEITYEDDEATADPTTNDNALASEEAEGDANQDMGMEYQDEIGYEDDETIPTHMLVASEEAEVVATSHLDPSFGNGDEGSESLETFGIQDIASKTKSTAVTDQDPGFEDPNEELSLHHGLGQPEEDTPGTNEPFGQGLDDLGDEVTHQPDISGPGKDSPAGVELENAEATASNSSLIPNITVHYAEGIYSLFGSPLDNPDSFFLSDTTELDKPLSQFLGSLRDVISDEIAPEDELLIHIEQLGFEFGEKSSNRFLSRTFHDILACSSAFAAKLPSTTPSLEFELVIRRDCEERFRELLETAGIQTDPSGLSVEAEDTDGPSPFSAAAAAESHEEPLADDYEEDYEADDVDEARFEGNDQVQAVEENDSVMSNGAPDAQTSLDEQGSPESAELEQHGQDSYEVNFADAFDDTEAAAEAAAEADDGYDDENGEISGEPRDEFTTDLDLEDTELSFGIPEHDAHLSGAETNGQDSLETNGLVASTGLDGEITLESAPNDIDVSLSLGPDTGPITGDDDTGYDDNFTASYDDTEHNRDGTEGTLGQDPQHDGFDIAEDLIESAIDGINGISNPAFLDTPQAAPSHHTSRTSTVNGEEIDYEELNAAEESAAFADETVEEHDDVEDEIDWRNDGEDVEDQKEATLTPSAGKRSRTDEAESLAEETDSKRRRT